MLFSQSNRLAFLFSPPRFILKNSPMEYPESYRPYPNNIKQLSCSDFSERTCVTRNAVDYFLQNNNPDFPDTANMESLSILSGLCANIKPEIFQMLFNDATARDSDQEHLQQAFERYGTIRLIPFS